MQSRNATDSEDDDVEGVFCIGGLSDAQLPSHPIRMLNMPGIY